MIPYGFVNRGKEGCCKMCIRDRYYLPEGRWTDFFTGEIQAGGRYYEGEFDYFSLPLYVRENTLLALGAVNDRPDYDYACLLYTSCQ